MTSINPLKLSGLNLAINDWNFYRICSTTAYLYTGYWLSYWSIVYFYRTTFHPLARFPGPTLAGMTFWYEFFYDLWPHQYRYTWKIIELHEKYGPIIRINPLQIHINDPDYFDEIYAGGGRIRDKVRSFHAVTEPEKRPASIIGTHLHNKHRHRRAPFAQYFSKRSIRSLEPLILSVVQQLVMRLHAQFLEQSVINLSDAYAALTADIISLYCFGPDARSKYLESDEYGKELRNTIQLGAQMNPVTRHFPTLQGMAAKLPAWVAHLISPQSGAVNDFFRDAARVINVVLEEKGGVEKGAHRTIFEEIRDSDMPTEEKQPSRLIQEAGLFIAGGTETTARTLSVISFYLTENRDVHERLFRDLKEAMPSVDSPITLVELEKLPYLMGCVYEGLRLANSIPGRSARVAPDEDLHYGEWVIPRGTPMMSSSLLLHTNPETFPNPSKFEPQRWVDNPQLTRYMFAFSRGSRSCLAMNLAYAELYLAIAIMFRRFEFEMYDTAEERDVLISRDPNLGLVDSKSVGIRAKIVKELKD